MIVAACSLAIIAAACWGGATPTPHAAAEIAVCTSLTEFSARIDQIKALDPATVTAQGVAARLGQLSTAWTAVKTSLEGVKVADEAALTAAWAGGKTAVENIPTNVPIATAVAGLKVAVAPIGVAVGEMKNGMNCQ